MTCPVCGREVQVTKAGRFYRHGDCAGGGRELAAGGIVSDAGVGSSRSAGGSDNQGDLPTPSTAVYLVRPGRRNEELRYSLRSLERHTSITRVVMVGSCPDWLTGVEHIPTGQTDRGDRAKNIRAGYAAIVDQLDVERFVLMNDDFFVMQPSELGPTHRGPLAQLLKSARPTGYFKGLRAVADLLPADALAYDAIHTPMPMTRAALAAALESFDGIHGVRTMVGNMLALGGELHPNAKNIDESRWAGLTYLSTSDKSFKYRPIGAFIRRRFREPSGWETT